MFLIDSFQKQLKSSIHQRERPEDVAQIIQNIFEINHASQKSISILKKAAQHSWSNNAVFFASSMSTSFFSHPGIGKKPNTFDLLTKQNHEFTPSQKQNTQLMREFVFECCAHIQKKFGDRFPDRLNRKQRKEKGVSYRKKKYNKIYRVIIQMERTLAVMQVENEKRKFTLIGKSGLATFLEPSDLNDLNTLCFIAYWTAVNNKRSEFTISSQQKNFDEISNLLFEICQNSSTTNWFAIAHVLPSEAVLSHLTDEQKGLLLGKWYEFLREIGGFLAEKWKELNPDKKTMIVKKGMDSTTWNNTASAWNNCRKNIISLLYSLNMENALDYLCVGKVLRVMAADLVQMHEMYGQGLHPDTHVFAKLPLPWEVLSGKAQCNRKMVEEVCESCKVNPIENGWVAPRKVGHVTSFTPTPELVHGVTVANPILATIFKKAGYFSGGK